jgi:anti-sigma regulatory factor (Ser/Thr protein kinase)
VDDGAPRVWLVLRRCAARVEVAVHDGRPLSDGPMGGSQDGRADDSAESGRGLRIVRALTDDVHVEQVTGDGKIVHASFGTRA